MTLAYSDISAGQRLARVGEVGDVVFVAVEQHGRGSATLIYRAAYGKLNERIQPRRRCRGVGVVAVANE